MPCVMVGLAKTRSARNPSNSSALCRLPGRASSHRVSTQPVVNVVVEVHATGILITCMQVGTVARCKTVGFPRSFRSINMRHVTPRGYEATRPSRYCVTPPAMPTKQSSANVVASDWLKELPRSTRSSRPAQKPLEAALAEALDRSVCDLLDFAGVSV